MTEPLLDGDLDPDGGGRRQRALVGEVMRLQADNDRLRSLIKGREFYEAHSGNGLHCIWCGASGPTTKWVPEDQVPPRARIVDTPKTKWNAGDAMIEVDADPHDADCSAFQPDGSVKRSATELQMRR